MFVSKVIVTLKEGILDPQGKAVHHALRSLGFREVEDVRIGKFILLKFNEGTPREQAYHQTQQMCQKLLANPVIEDYQFQIEEDEK